MTTRILLGDALETLRTLPDASVHCCITSPPYWGLRAYGGDAGMIGLEPTFEAHLYNLVQIFREVRRVLRADGTLWLNYGDAYAGKWKGGGGEGLQRTNGGSRIAYDVQPAWTKPKDLLMMPARVAIALQDDGWWLRSEIVWHKPNPMPESARDRPTSAHEKIYLFTKSGAPLFWTHRDGLPGTRSKPGPDFFWRNRQTGEETADEPEGWRELTDEDDRHLWARINKWVGWDYFYDGEAVRTPVKESTVARLSQPTFETQTGGPKDPKSGNRSHRKVLENLHRRVPAGWATSPSYDDQDPRYKSRAPKDLDGRSARLGRAPGWRTEQRQRGEPPRHEQYDTGHQTLDDYPRGAANLRNVWVIATAPYREAHFATFPPALIERPIKAGTSEKGCCPACGAPWARVPGAPVPVDGRGSGNKQRKLRGDHGGNPDHNPDRGCYFPWEPTATPTVGWAPTCGCNAGDPVPATILDPFAGSGTVGLVADRLQRDAVLIEINGEYVDMARRRLGADAPLLAEAS